jgi:ubiquinone/menaquinone biosynthesis C-methylase UbiE
VDYECEKRPRKADDGAGEGMNSQQTAELRFWSMCFKRCGYTKEEYVDVRAVRDFNEYARYLPEIHEETGQGLDLACGLVSVLEGLPRKDGLKILAVDALMDEYNKIYQHPSHLDYRLVDGEDMYFEHETFDFVWCINAIDHTLNPEAMLAEILRVLKPGGRLYFLVNFDPSLGKPHYEVWSAPLVEQRMKAFHLVRGTLYWNTLWEEKYIWSALYQKR